MSTPLSNTAYRIQSADFLNFMEVISHKDRRPEKGPPVGLRPFRENQTQHWYFEQAEGVEGRFYIRSLFNQQYLEYDDGLRTGGRNMIFHIFPPSSRPREEGKPYPYYIWGGNSTNWRLQSSDSGTGITVVYGGFSVDDLILEPIWHVIPITPHKPLEPGDYRIRSLDGRSLLTMPTDTSGGDYGIYADAQAPEDSYQKWSLNWNSSSGNYTIQSPGNSLYIGYSSSQKGQNVVGVATSTEWELESVGGFAWSIRVPNRKLSVGFPDLEGHHGDKVTLVEIDNAASQLWFLEKYVPIGKEQIHQKREVDGGKNYFIQNAGNPSIFMNVTADKPWNIIPGDKFNADMFKLEYVSDNSTNFTLTNSAARPGGTKILPVASRQNYLGFDVSPTKFVLFKKDRQDSAYYICDANSGSGKPQRVVSGRTITQFLDEVDVFSMEDMKDGDSLQLWRLSDNPPF